MRGECLWEARQWVRTWERGEACKQDLKEVAQLVETRFYFSLGGFLIPFSLSLPPSLFFLPPSSLLSFSLATFIKYFSHSRHWVKHCGENRQKKYSFCFQVVYSLVEEKPDNTHTDTQPSAETSLCFSHSDGQSWISLLILMSWEIPFLSPLPRDTAKLI